MAKKKHTTNFKAERIAGFQDLEKKSGKKKHSKKRVAGK
jgi:hypothetical protein